MVAPFVGEIRMFSGNYAPVGWALCDGQLIDTSQNEALFSVLGSVYGGDGRTTFGLPDLRGRIPIHQGSGPALTPRSIGSKTGTENVVLTAADLPAHGHEVFGSASAATSPSPVGNAPAISVINLYNAATPAVALAPASVLQTGSGVAHDNLMQCTAISFIIALQGLIPSRF